VSSVGDNLTDQIKKCGQANCNPQIAQEYCCGIEYRVKCACGKQAEFEAAQKDWAVEIWNNEIEEGQKQ